MPVQLIAHAVIHSSRFCSVIRYFFVIIIFEISKLLFSLLKQKKAEDHIMNDTVLLGNIFSFTFFLSSCKRKNHTSAWVKWRGNGKLEHTAMNLSSLCFRVFFARVDTSTEALSNHTSMVTCLARIVWSSITVLYWFDQIKLPYNLE